MHSNTTNSNNNNGNDNEDSSSDVSSLNNKRIQSNTTTTSSNNSIRWKNLGSHCWPWIRRERIPSNRSNPQRQKVITLKCSRKMPFDKIITKLQSNLDNCLVRLDLLHQYLSQNQIQPLVQCFHQETFLQCLSLSWTGITDAMGGIQLVQSLATHVHLQELWLYGIKLSDDAVKELSKGLLGNPKNSLTTLNLGGNSITSVGGMALAKSLQCNNLLTHLYLYDNPVLDQTVIQLAQGLLRYKHTALQTLNLKNTETSDMGATELAMALKCSNTTLVELDLARNQITNKGATELAHALEHNHTLTDLDLSHNQISDEGATALANALFQNATLQELGLAGNQPSDVGVTQLVEAQRKNESLTIDLVNNPITSSISKGVAQELYSQSFYTWDPFAYLYGLGNKRQNRKGAFEDYLEQNELGVVTAADNLGWMHRSGCGTDVSIDQAKQCLEEAIAKHPLPSSLFNLADILASSTKISDLHQAKELISRIDKDSDIFQRGQWLLPFIDRQLELLDDMEDFPLGDLRPDFIHDADLQVVAYIGRGQFGKVYLGHLQREKWVAVKFLSVELIETEEKEQATLLLCERFTWRMLDVCEVPNVAKYIGFVDDLGNNQRGLVFELCADISKVKNKAEKMVKEFTSVRFIKNLDTTPDWSDCVRSSLRSMVVLAHRRQFSLSKIIYMLYQVAESLAGIHKSGFLHRDIADRNILCDKLGNVQLTDMGLAKFMGGGPHVDGACHDHIDAYQCYLTPGNYYSLAWHAPECIGEQHTDHIKMFKAVFSTNSDVYSFGMVMWQCFSHRDPFDESRYRPCDIKDKESVERKAKEVALAILNGERPDLGVLDKDTPQMLVDLISMCWETDPEKRPSIDYIINELGKIGLAVSEGTRKPVSLIQRRAKDCKRKWYDVAPLYFSIPHLDGNQEMSAFERGSFKHQMMQQQLVPPSQLLRERMDDLILRANALDDSRDILGQCVVLRQMQALERGLMKWLSGLAVKEAEENYKPDDREVLWIQHISRFYHAVVPLLRVVLKQENTARELPPPPEVFISHAGRQKYSYAIPTANHLRKVGVKNVFIDKDMQIGLKGNNQMMWAAVSCKFFWCVLSKDFIRRWYPLRELMIGLVRHVQESSQDFILLLDCLEQGRNPNGMWMETILKMKSLELYQHDGSECTEHSFPTSMQKGRDESFDERIERISTMLFGKESCLEENTSSSSVE